MKEKIKKSTEQQQYNEFERIGETLASSDYGSCNEIIEILMKYTTKQKYK